MLRKEYILVAQKEFYSPTKYNEHVGHEGEDNDSDIMMNLPR